MDTNYLLYILLVNVFLSCDLCLKCSCSFIFLFFLLKLHATKSTTVESYVQASDRRMSEPLESSFFGHCYYFHFFYVLKFLLQYSCFTMLCYLLSYKVNQLHVYIYPFFFGISFPFRSSQSIEWSSLCYTVGSHQLFFIQSSNSAYMSIPISQFIPPHYPPSIHMFVLCLSISVL